MRSSPETAGDDATTPLGAEVERLRQERGLSKQGLAKLAGVSRTHLWRALTGRSELSRTEFRRLADALGVPEGLLAAAETGGQWEPEPNETAAGTPTADDLEAFITDARRILRTLDTLPGGPIGRDWKLELLSGIEEAAKAKPAKLPAEFWDIRRRVYEGEL